MQLSTQYQSLLGKWIAFSLSFIFFSNYSYAEYDLLTTEILGERTVSVFLHGETLNITEWDSPKIGLKAANQYILKNYSFEETEKEIVIKTKTSFIYDSPKVPITLFVPRNCEIYLEAKDGRVTLENIYANLFLHKKTGDVSLKNVGGSVLINSSHSNLLAEHVDANVKFETINGDVNITSGAGSWDLTKVNGDLYVSSDLKRLVVNSVNGNNTINTNKFDEINVQAVNSLMLVNTAMYKGAKMELSSVDGEIHVYLDEKTSTKIYAETRKTINNQISGNAPVLGDDGMTNRLKARLGKGESDLIIKSKHAEIVLSEKDHP